ncbi:MAG: class I SAM-dependent methyltransferase [Gammaproteobacteria bacterium]
MQGPGRQLEPGKVWFNDPSQADVLLSDAMKVDRYFKGSGVNNIRHFRRTSQDFVVIEDYADLNEVGLLMVDGYHTAEQAQFDYLAFLDKLSDSALALFHDSASRKLSTFYGDDKIYKHTIYQFMHRLQATMGVEVLNLPFGTGLTMVRGRPTSLDGFDLPFEQ